MPIYLLCVSRHINDVAILHFPLGETAVSLFSVYDSMGSDLCTILNFSARWQPRSLRLSCTNSSVQDVDKIRFFQSISGLSFIHKIIYYAHMVIFVSVQLFVSLIFDYFYLIFIFAPSNPLYN